MAKRISVLLSDAAPISPHCLRQWARATGREINRVIANVPDAPGLALARAHSVEAVALDHRNFPTREAFDAELALVIDAARPDVVVMAGFMRVLGESFVRRYSGRLINVHPSLLPLYPGLHTHRRALADGARVRLHGPFRDA
jgi:phosphoribosylglycinamide formyltransferase-1